MKHCCQLHQQIRAKTEPFIKSMYALIGGNPRHWLMVYDYLKEKGMSNMSIKIAMSKECPCKSEQPEEVTHDGQGHSTGDG